MKYTEPKPSTFHPRIIPAADRFRAKVDQRGPNECWYWTAGLLKAGYGGFHPIPSVTVTAHQFAYELAFGPVPTGKWIDHTCHNGTDCTGGNSCLHRRCCNPEHLEAVDPIENQLRSHATRGAQARCPNGHEYTPDNVRLLPDKGLNGWRVCRKCEAAKRNRRRRG